MCLRRCLAWLALPALFALLGLPVAAAAPSPEPAPSPNAAHRVEVFGIPPQVRAGAPATEFAVTFHNAERQQPLRLDPEARFGGDRALTAEHVRFEVFDPASGSWVATPLDEDGVARLPFRGPGRLTEHSGRLPPRTSLELRLRFTLSANATAQFAFVAISGRAVPEAPDAEPRFTTATYVTTVLLAADGGAPVIAPTPGTSRPPSEPDAGPQQVGGTPKPVPQSRSTGAPAISLFGVPGWLQAGGGAAEFQFAVSNEASRVFDHTEPQLVFTAGRLDLPPDALKVEARSGGGAGWEPVQLTVLMDPASGRGTHLIGSLTPPGMGIGRTSGVDELVTIRVRVSFPAGSPATGHDVAVLGATGYPGGVEQRPLSHSDFQVFTVTASGPPNHTPTLDPDLPGLGPPEPDENPADDGNVAKKAPQRGDPFTWATIAIWLALGAIAGLVGYFAVKNRREGAGPASGPGA